MYETMKNIFVYYNLILVLLVTSKLLRPQIIHQIQTMKANREGCANCLVLTKINKLFAETRVEKMENISNRLSLADIVDRLQWENTLYAWKVELQSEKTHLGTLCLKGGTKTYEKGLTDPRLRNTST